MISDLVIYILREYELIKRTFIILFMRHLFNSCVKNICLVEEGKFWNHIMIGEIPFL